MDFVTVSTGLILPYWMGLPIRYIHYLILTLKTGDYYSHENIKTYTLVIEEGKIKVMEDYE